MFTAALHTVGKQNKTTPGWPKLSPFLNYPYCEDTAIVSILVVQSPFKGLLVLGPRKEVKLLPADIKQLSGYTGEKPAIYRNSWQTRKKNIKVWINKHLKFHGQEEREKLSKYCWYWILGKILRVVQGKWRALETNKGSLWTIQDSCKLSRGCFKLSRAVLSINNLPTWLGIKGRAVNSMWKLRTSFMVHLRLVSRLKTQDHTVLRLVLGQAQHS